MGATLSWSSSFGTRLDSLNYNIFTVVGHLCDMARHNIIYSHNRKLYWYCNLEENRRYQDSSFQGSFSDWYRVFLAFTGYRIATWNCKSNIQLDRPAGLFSDNRHRLTEAVSSRCKRLNRLNASRSATSKFLARVFTVVLFWYWLNLLLVPACGQSVVRGFQACFSRFSWDRV